MCKRSSVTEFPIYHFSKLTGMFALPQCGWSWMWSFVQKWRLRFGRERLCFLSTRLPFYVPRKRRDFVLWQGQCKCCEICERTGAKFPLLFSETMNELNKRYSLDVLSAKSIVTVPEWWTRVIWSSLHDAPVEYHRMLPLKSMCTRF